MSTEPNLNDSDYQLLSAYIDGMLEDEERSALEARLQEEPALRRELAALRQTVSLVKQLPPLKAPRDFTLTEAMVSPESSRRDQRTPIIFPLMTALSAAASFILIAVGLIVLNNPGEPPLESIEDSIVSLYSNVSPRERSQTAAGEVAAAASPTAGLLTVTPAQTSSAGTMGRSEQRLNNQVTDEDAGAEPLADLEQPEEAEGEAVTTQAAQAPLPAGVEMTSPPTTLIQPSVGEEPPSGADDGMEAAAGTPAPEAEEEAAESLDMPQALAAPQTATSEVVASEFNGMTAPRAAAPTVTPSPTQTPSPAPTETLMALPTPTINPTALAQAAESPRDSTFRENQGFDTTDRISNDNNTLLGIGLVVAGGIILVYVTLSVWIYYRRQES